MKKFLFLAVVLFIAYAAYTKHREHERAKLVGAWAMEKTERGASFRQILNLKPDGVATVEIDAQVQGRYASKEAVGDWKYVRSHLVVVFRKSELAPFVVTNKEYGGRILTADDKTLSYQDDQNKVDSWTRIR